MNNLIQNLSIGQYRGIKSLVINNLNNVNIIVGDNNSGKTSLLETIYLLRSPHSFNNVIRSSRLRNIVPFASSSPYESFVNIFPKVCPEELELLLPVVLLECFPIGKLPIPLLALLPTLKVLCVILIGLFKA